MSGQTLTPLRLKKIKSLDITARRRFSFSSADTKSAASIKQSDHSMAGKGSPQFRRLLSPKHWRLKSIKHTDQNESTSSLPDRIQRNPQDSPVIDRACILRVYASDLHPDILYKTITVTAETTALETMQWLLNKYAVDEDDKDPSKFYLAEVRETSKGSYTRNLNDDECPLQAQQTWSKSSEWSFWLIRKEQIPDKNSFEFRPSRDKELEVPINVSFLNKEYNTITVLMSEDSCCDDTIQKVLVKCDLSDESITDYCLWEMMGDGSQMTGKPLMATDKALQNKRMILNGDVTLCLRPQGGDPSAVSPSYLDKIFSASSHNCDKPFAWISNTQSQGDNEDTTPSTFHLSLTKDTTKGLSSMLPGSSQAQPHLTHSNSENDQLFQKSEFAKNSIENDLPFSLPKELNKDKPPVILITNGTDPSTGTSTNCSTESIIETQSNSTASETLHTSLASSTTEVDIVQEAKSPCLSNAVRVRINYACSPYRDPNYIPPKQLSRIIEELIKGGMPRLMRKIVEETKATRQRSPNIFNFDFPPNGITSPQGDSHINKLINSGSVNSSLPNAGYVLSNPPDKQNKIDIPLSPSSSDNKADSELSPQTPPNQLSFSLPHSAVGKIRDQHNKLQRSHSLMSERRRMDILRNLSESVKDRLRSHSSSAQPNSLPTSSNSSTPIGSGSGSWSSSPTKSYSVNVILTSLQRKSPLSPPSDPSTVPAPKNKVRRWISFNYGDKSKSKAAQKYLKNIEQKEHP